MNETGNETSFRAETVPLPTLDISTPEAAVFSARRLLIWRYDGSKLSPELKEQIDYVHCGVDFMRFPNAHKSEAAKQLVQEAIDKLREMLTAQSSGYQR